MLADDMPPTTRARNSHARLGAHAVTRKLMHMPAIEYISTGRRPIRSLSAPSAGMKMNCISPNTIVSTPNHIACSSRAATNSPTSSGITGTIRPMPSMSMKMQTRMKLRLPGRGGGLAGLLVMGCQALAGRKKRSGIVTQERPSRAAPGLMRVARPRAATAHRPPHSCGAGSSAA
jgi:hypothetical protein